MSIHSAQLTWRPAAGDEFLRGRYTRLHEIAFDGGATIMGSPSPSVVREPFSSAAAVDPEEMFLASIASCHMLWFLDFARRAGLAILSYRDQPEAILEKNADGRTAVSRVTLRPAVECEGDRTKLAEIHRRAHDACFIANSVKSEVVVEPQ